MAEKNYYDILGVDKKASEADIKKAYRKLVRQYHPDINDSPDADAKMGEINNAYETLKDAEKRAQYDLMLDNPYMGQGFGGMGGGMGGGQGFNANMSQADLDEILRQFGAGAGGRQSQGAGGFRFDDIFSTFGGGAGGFSDGFGGRQSQRSTKGDDQHAELSIDLKATYEGDTRKISLSLPVQTATGLDYQTKTIEVKIPRGIAEGQQIRLAKQGNPSPYGGDNGDLYLKIKFNHPDNIRVEGKDVFQTVDVAPWEAAMGGQITVNTPAGKVNVNVPKNSRTGTNLRLKGKGIPAKEAGDLYLSLNIVLPKINTDADIQAFEAFKSAFASFVPTR